MEYNKVIFLDIDGVLNCGYPNNHLDVDRSHWAKRTKIRNFVREESNRLLANSFNILYDVYDLDIDKIQVLNEIIKQTNANIVISSAWRDMENLKLLLTIRGFEYPENIIGKTGHFDNRGIEIIEYIKEDADIDKYIIIDDEEGQICDYECHTNKLLKVRGLQKEHINQAIEMLNNSWI